VKPASEESRCDLAVETIYGVGSVIRLGQKGRRTRNTGGVPDRVYFCGPRVLWWEVKSKHDYLSPEQIIFLHNILERGGMAGCGRREDLLALLNAPNPRKVALAQIEYYRSLAGRSKPLTETTP
jgi:hypothetical protein